MAVADFHNSYGLSSIPVKYVKFGGEVLAGSIRHNAPMMPW
jgi:hypothetical protein